MKKTAIGIILSASLLYAAWQALNLYDDRFRFGRMWETPAIRPLEAVLPAMDAGSVPLSGGEARFQAIDTDSLTSPLAGKESEYVLAGKNLYFTYCAQCHGKNLDGNGTVGQSFSPLPTDLRSTQVQTLSDGLMFDRISYGNPPQGRQPALATTIDVPDRWQIIAFIRMTGQRKDVHP